MSCSMSQPPVTTTSRSWADATVVTKDNTRSVAARFIMVVSREDGEDGTVTMVGGDYGV
jgi:hypothetical protein